MSITLDRRSGRVLNRQVIPDNPTDLEKAFRELDGSEVTLLIIDRPGSTLSVAGGPETYSVSLQVGGDRFYQLLGDRSQSGWQGINLGGQLVNWPRRFFVQLDAALSTAKRFLIAGEAVRDGNWEEVGRDLTA